MTDLLKLPEEMVCPTCDCASFSWTKDSLNGLAKLSTARLLAKLAHRIIFLRFRCRHCKQIVPHVHVLPRTVVGNHGCHRDFARELIAGRVSTQAWKLSQNDYDWLGEGVYFWEHAPGRALEWARERHGENAAVVAAEIKLGRCLDLGDTVFTDLLRQAYQITKALYEREGLLLPKNMGRQLKLRKLDRLILDKVTEASDQPGGPHYQTVRCPFEEGEEVYEGGMIKTLSHVQIAVRDWKCISPKLFLIDPVGG